MDPTTQRYRAFISYSQRDRQHAKRLHSALETYRVPKGIDAPLQPNRRLGRFFRDDDEMGASVDLGGALREALENSENLIVICSPNAARSKWVNEEILHFKKSGSGDRIFAVIIDGIPNSSDPETNCFPHALGADEPLAVDLTKEKFSRARLRLVAGLLGISFDSLWQREKRRTLKRRAVAATATLVLASGIGLLGFRWLTERAQGHAQTINRTLGTVRDDLASDRVKSALAELDRLNADGEKGDVEEVLKSTLSWMSTPAELFKEIKPPAVFSNESQLFLLASNGSRHHLNLHQPYRRVWSSDKRWLLVLGADEAVVLDVADGRELARTPADQIDWQGEAFETGSGLLLVVGRRGGISTGSFRESFLVFSPQKQTLTVFGKHWESDDGIKYRFLHPLYVSSDCRSFGVVSDDLKFEDESSSTPTPSEMFFISADGNGLQVAPAPESVTDWSAAAMFPDEKDRLGSKRYEVGGPISYGTGCKAPAGDSKHLGSQHGLAGLVRPIGFGTFWEPEKKWKVTGEAEPPVDRFSEENRPAGPCTEERPCKVQDAEAQKTFDGSIDPVDITRPRGVPKSDRSFDSVNGEFVHTFFTQFNAGFSAAWCRKLDSAIVCLEKDTGAELIDDITEADVRSNTGRYVFFSQGAMNGFRLYDLLTMKNVTPRGSELIASTFWTDFSPDDKRLFVALKGRLLVFEPKSEGAPWQQVSDGRSVNFPVLSASNENDKIAGLLAVDDSTLIAVRGSGVVSRFDWRTGQQSWERTIGNLGEVVRVVMSRNRRFLLLIGRAGGRLLDTKDGLVMSGVLVPSPAMDGSIDVFQCFNQAFVSDTGAIDVSCGEKIYRREPSVFQGDMRSRLREILSSEL